MKFRKFVEAVGYRVVQASRWGLPADRLDLTGDRDVEWAWVAARIPADAGRVLDLGPATSFTPLIAAFKGGEVQAVDLDPPPVPFVHPRLTYVKGDVLTDGDLPPGMFDVIINCSTTEHIGLSGRYGSREDADGDLKAMAILRARLAGPQARMVFTIPVGRDGVYHPYHRIYGQDRLPRLLAGFTVVDEQYFAKTGSQNAWKPVSRDEALRIEGSSSFYALGLFVLAAP